jgi:hypothetical protein
LQKKVRENKGNRYSLKIIKNVTLIVREDKICVPLALQEHIIAWYHEYLAHPGRNRTDADVMEAFSNNWILQYLRPQYIGFDNGSKFKSVFIQTCIDYGIKPKPSTSHNPQSNGIIECLKGYI